MAGSSQDGLDLALVRLQYLGETWRYDVLHAQTEPYPLALRERLLDAADSPSHALLSLHVDYTYWTAAVLQKHLTRFVYDLIAWHGPTIFHNPSQRLTWALGDAELLSALTGRPVVTHFRARDLAYGGQGAPLIPNADELLWPQYPTLLNLGGICNVTHLPSRKAFDIGPCNQLLNALARELSPPLPYDPAGQFARQGSYLPALAQRFWEAPPLQNRPTALANVDIQTHFIEPFLTFAANPIDKLHTATRCIANLIAQKLNALKTPTVLMTGGGTYNAFLLELIQTQITPATTILIPDSTLIEFREAIGFALLGLLRYLELTNVDGRWTGGTHRHSSGSLSL